MMVKLLQLIIKQQKKEFLACGCLEKFDLCLKEKNEELNETASWKNIMNIPHF